jgi:DNA-binding MarR family transcriptional regulator
MSALPVDAEGPQIVDDDLARLRMAFGRIGRVLRQQTDDGLSYPLMSLLLSIFRTQPVSAGDLAAAEGVSPPSVTRSLNRLIQLGYVSRETDPADRRAALITLTPRGMQERDLILRRREIWLTQHLGQLADCDVVTLLNALPVLERLCDPALPSQQAIYVVPE